MAPRDPLSTVRDAVHRAVQPLRTARDATTSDTTTSDPTSSDPDGGSRGDLPREDERGEELAAMREADRRLGADTDRAARATWTAQAYLAARRRRLKRELDGARR